MRSSYLHALGNLWPSSLAASSLHPATTPSAGASSWRACRLALAAAALAGCGQVLDLRDPEAGPPADGAPPSDAAVGEDAAIPDGTPVDAPDPGLCNSMVAFEDGVGSLRDVWVSGPGGGGRLNVSANVADDMRPSWVPDGRILFISERAGQRDAWIVDAQGRNLRNLTGSIAEPVEYATVSPDGARLAFSRGGDTPDNSIWTMKIDGTDVRQVSTLPIDRGPIVWSPDGTRLVYSHKISGGAIPDLVLVDLRGGVEPRKLAATSAYENVTRGAWSPDGTRIVFHRFRDVWVVEASDTDGRTAYNLTPDTPSNDYEPHWAPDGRHVVFASDRVGSIYRVYWVSASGGVPKAITNPMGAAGSFGDIPTQVAPDGVHVLFERSTRDSSNRTLAQIGTVKIDGAEEYAFNIDSTAPNVTWSPCLSTVLP